jgi:hypothetical protein
MNYFIMLCHSTWLVTYMLQFHHWPGIDFMLGA